MSNSPYRKMNLTYSPRIHEGEKDLIISQLKSQVFELEQNEKNFNNLNLRVRSLQSEANILSEEKLRLEYELKQKTESTDKLILDLRHTIESLQLELSDKIQVNKKLYSDNTNFYKMLDARNNELNDLTDDRNRIIDENSELRERLAQLESSQVHDKNNISSLKNQVEIVNRELDKSSNNISDLNDALRSAQSENNSLAVKLEENKREISNLNGLLKRKEDSLVYSSKTIDELNANIQGLKGKNLELERKISQLSSEANQINNNFNNEKNIRASIEKSNQQLEGLLSEKDSENRKLFSDNAELKSQLERSTLETKIYINELEKLKNHIYALTEQNQILSDELEAIISRDEQIRQQLDRKGKIYNLLNANRNKIDASLASIEKKKY